MSLAKDWGIVLTTTKVFSRLESKYRAVAALTCPREETSRVIDRYADGRSLEFQIEAVRRAGGNGSCLALVCGIVAGRDR
jgi:hypothetical protein